VKRDAKDAIYIGGTFRDSLPNIDPATAQRYLKYEQTKPALRPRLESPMTNGVVAHGQALTVDRISLAFAGLHVLTDVSMALEPGVITGLIGPNGAGKTSLFNCLNGLYRGQRGDIAFAGTPLRGARPGTTGVAWHCAQLSEPGVVPRSVGHVGLTLKRRSGWFSAFVPTAGRRAEQADAERRAMTAVCTENLNPDVVMMKSAEYHE
jgi:ABC-type branched-subunit amino acid transport system ATPase component